MSINKLSHLKEGEKIYLEVTRELSTSDDDSGLMFRATSSYATFVDDTDTFYFPDELKQLANDGMPKQGEMIEGSNEMGVWVKERFITHYQGKFITVDDNGYYSGWNDCRIPKTELTLAEVEEKLGIEKGSLIIKD